MTSQRLMVHVKVVEVGGARISVDLEHPVALIETEATREFRSWPSAPLPPTAGSVEVIAASDAAWVVYASDEGIADLPEDIRYTAIRVPIVGGIGAMDLGNMAAVGADSSGIWCTQPTDEDTELVAQYDAFVPPEIDLTEDSPLEDWSDLPSSRGIDLDLASLNGLNEGPLDESMQATGERGIGLGFWVGEDEEPSAPDDLEPTKPSVLVHLGLDGARQEVEVDRTVHRVTEVEGGLRVEYFPTEAWEGLHGRMNYPMRAIEMAPGLPSQLSTDVVSSVDLGVRDFFAEIETGAAIILEPPVSLTGVDGDEWVVRPTSFDVSKIVEWTRNQLLGLDEDQRVWTRADNSWHRVRSDYRNVTVDVRGEWPSVEVVADFQWSNWDDAWVRFSVEPFDAAGRPAVLEFLTVYLEEDLATQEPEDFELTADGFRELSAHRHLH